MVSDALVEEVRARADIVELCGEYTSLKRVGKSYRGPCPLHGGEGNNFAVDPDRGIFKCFVCGEGGDVFGFLMKRLGLDFPSAVRQIGTRVGIEVPDREERREDPYRHLREVAAFAAEWFAEQLWGPGGSGARAYLEGRGISESSAKTFGLGYAPAEWRGLSEAAGQRGVEERLLLELGLLATSERADTPYDRFRNRLIFTILDLRDRPIAFGGRWLGSADDDVPKYINSPDSPIFHKGKTLYGLNWARHEIRRESHAVIVEGFTDVLAMHNGELPVAVAGLGTAFTRDQAESLRRYAERAYLLYDSDEPGLRATFKTADILLETGIHPLVVTLPEGEDPDSLIRARGGEEMRRYLSDAVDVLERKLQILERRGFLADADGRRRAVDGLLSTLRAVRDMALRDIYLDRVSERTGVRRETLVHEVASRVPAGPRHPPRRRERSDPDAGADRGPSRVERNLVLLLVRDPQLVARAAETGLDVDHFRHPGLRAIFATISVTDPESDPSDWIRELDAETANLGVELLEDDTELTKPGEIFEDSLLRLLHRPRLERLVEIDRELELAEERQARDLLIEKEQLARELREAGLPLGFVRMRRKGAAPAHGP